LLLAASPWNTLLSIRSLSLSLLRIRLVSRKWSERLLLPLP
jgi:hypothetical protein